MQIKYTTPPNWDKIVAKFNVKETDHNYYTYGDCIYIPSRIQVTQDILRHEMTHAEQQNHDENVANIWWQNYIHDPEFRLDQEVEAYGNQYYFLCQNNKDRNKQARILHEFASVLAGPLYNNCVEYQEAYRRIKESSKLSPDLDTQKK
jgi:hypothetical protein